MSSMIENVLFLVVVRKKEKKVFDARRRSF